ncbi:hypothetical protein LIER_35459 [Lithospermum erythrorhizon]|uniref:Uncharacterized protein n=1 Tax=Lithospermum erythrorhizon TaxID=34254 RepID=A0AAV3NQX8_LITER
MARYSYRSSPSFGLVNNFGDPNYSFSSEKALVHSPSHSKGFLDACLIFLMKGRLRSPDLEMNLLNAASRPASLCTSL